MPDTMADLQAIIRHATGSKNGNDLPAKAPLQTIVRSSLQFVVIIAEIERVFGITVPDAYLDAAKFPDVSSVAALIDELRTTPA